MTGTAVESDKMSNGPMLDSDGWMAVAKSVASRLFELEKEGRLVPPVDVTLSGIQDDVIAVHFQYQGARGSDRNCLQGDLTPGAMDLKATWPLVAHLEDAAGNVWEIELEPQKPM